VSFWKRLVNLFNDNASGDDGAETAAAVLEAPASPSDAVLEHPLPWYSAEPGAFLEPVPPVRPEMTAEEHILENLLVSHFDGHDLTLPPLPQVPDAVLKQLRGKDCDFNAIAETLAEDQVAAAAVLRAANSPLYRGAQQITSLQQAVTRLGTHAIHTLMMHQSLRATMQTTARAGRELAQLIWRRSLVSGMVMRELCRFTRLNPEDSQVIGLLHNVGDVIVLRVATDSRLYGAAVPPIDVFEYFCHQTHQEFGELVAEQWNLPKTLQSLISHHHTYPQVNDPLRTERLQLLLADMIVQMLGVGPTRGAYDLLACRPAWDLDLPNRGDYIRFLDGLPETVAQMMTWY
jgi:HD-like signal output (HDOD) protein